MRACGQSRSLKVLKHPSLVPQRIAGLSFAGYECGPQPDVRIPGDLIINSAKLLQNDGLTLSSVGQLEHDMALNIEKNSDGSMRIAKEKGRHGRVNTKLLAAGIVLCLGVVIVAGAQAVLASGDNNCWNYGEDGMYEENNNNTFPDDEFPGDADQLRGGVIWPDEPEELQ